MPKIGKLSSSSLMKSPRKTQALAVLPRTTLALLPTFGLVSNAPRAGI
jgi:hypothetical protein